jgi:argininosuccinate synthase
MATEKIVLAYSGGLDTSVCIEYLRTFHKLDVITLTVDCGQNEDFKAIEERALAIGAKRHVFVDGKEEFARDFVIPCIKSNGLYQNKYPLATALSRPLIATRIVEEAHRLGAVAVAHGCTGKGNDQIRFDVTIRSLDSDLKIIAPIRDMNLTRDLEIKFARERNIPISSEAKRYSVDLNLWGRSIEGGLIEDAYSEPPFDVFQLVKFNNNAPGYLELEFEDGIPVAVDDERMNITSLIRYVNEKAGSFGVGIIDHIEDRVVGIKSREIYEAPAAVVILEAHKDLEKMVLSAHELNFKRIVDEQWSWLVYSGLWKNPLRSHLDRFIDATQKKVSGKVKLRMQTGSTRVVGRRSGNSLYRNELATFTTRSTFDQSSAKGFVQLWGLQSTIANLVPKEPRSSQNENGDVNNI